MTEHEPSAEQPSYWHEDQPLGMIYLGRHPRLVHARSHQETETFRGRDSETFFTLTEREVERGYVQSRLSIHAPEASRREQRIADAQAWFYPADQTIVLWELILLPPLNQHAEPREDLVLRSLWSHYKRFLVARFPAMRCSPPGRIPTTGSSGAPFSTPSATARRVRRSSGRAFSNHTAASAPCDGMV